MASAGTFGEFLRARRERLRPADLGLSEVGPRRRVRGLRREEVAQLAGVGVSYYTRLEQGLSRHASAQVLAALAGALRLDPDEREHLDRLAGTAGRRPTLRQPEPERVGRETRDLVHAVDDAPALVLGRRTDVLAWNHVGHALLAAHLDPRCPEDPGTRPNLTRMTFLDPCCRELYVDWPGKAAALVGNLRFIAGRYPQDAALAALITELSTGSPAFVALWAQHRVTPCAGDTYTLRHPVVGAVTVTQQTLAISGSPQQRLVVVTAEPGSPSADALRRLARTTASGSGDPGPST